MLSMSGFAWSLAMRPPAGRCWRTLCEEGKDKQYINEVNLDHANRIVEALARHGQECEEKVRFLLSQKRSMTTATTQ